MLFGLCSFRVGKISRRKLNVVRANTEKQAVLIAKGFKRQSADIIWFDRC